MLLTRNLYLRLLGVVAFIAIGSFAWQLPGLIGSNGIWPAQQTLKAAWEQGVPLLDLPTLAWLSRSDLMLKAIAWLACALSLLLAAGVAPRACLFMIWLLWLSLVSVGGPFLSFQWDVLLLETLFFSIFFAPKGVLPFRKPQREPTWWARLILIALIAKVTFFSGLVKLASGDIVWRDLTAIAYHHWTQPLPAWTGYFASQLPMAIQKVFCLLTFVLELIVPLLAFGPRRLRIASGLGMILLQLGLFIDGNYSYFNVLSFVLCLALLDDKFMLSPWPKKLRAPEPPEVLEVERPQWQQIAGIAVLVTVLMLSAVVSLRRVVHGPLPEPLHSVTRVLAPFETINAYGAFAVMTKTRPEIIIEGSPDGQTWTEYQFKYKPGALDRRPGFIAPWQPRLDWQMWFAALGTCENNPWFLELQRHLLLGTDDVLALMRERPFPPTMIRTTVYDYTFAPMSESGVWWSRANPRPYCPPVKLDDTDHLVRAQLGPR